MTEEAFSFVSLTQHIVAKQARRESLVAEVAKIDAEIAEARRLLSIDGAAAGPAPRQGKLAVKACRRCPAKFLGSRHQTLCQGCRAAQAGRAGAASAAAHRQLRRLAAAGGAGV